MAREAVRRGGSPHATRSFVLGSQVPLYVLVVGLYFAR
jgi:hypothetical protein